MRDMFKTKIKNGDPQRELNLQWCEMCIYMLLSSEFTILCRLVIYLVVRKSPNLRFLMGNKYWMVVNFESTIIKISGVKMWSLWI